MKTLFKVLCVLQLIVPISAFAQVELTTEMFKVVTMTDKNGKQKVEWQAADNIVPGDKVGYRIRFANTGTEPADDLVLNNPIPENTVYVSNSARGANSEILFSVNGGSLFDHADKLYVLKDGKKVKAAPKDYTNVRWVISTALKAGENRSVQYVVQVQ